MSQIGTPAQPVAGSRATSGLQAGYKRATNRSLEGVLDPNAVEIASVGQILRQHGVAALRSRGLDDGCVPVGDPITFGGVGGGHEDGNGVLLHREAKPGFGQASLLILDKPPFRAYISFVG